MRKTEIKVTYMVNNGFSLTLENPKGVGASGTTLVANFEGDVREYAFSEPLDVMINAGIDLKSLRKCETGQLRQQIDTSASLAILREAAISKFNGTPIAKRSPKDKKRIIETLKGLNELRDRPDDFLGLAHQNDDLFTPSGNETDGPPEAGSFWASLPKKEFDFPHALVLTSLKDALSTPHHDLEVSDITKDDLNGAEQDIPLFLEEKWKVKRDTEQPEGERPDFGA